MKRHWEREQRTEQTLLEHYNPLYLSPSLLLCSSVCPSLIIISQHQTTGRSKQGQGVYNAKCHTLHTHTQKEKVGPCRKKYTSTMVSVCMFAGWCLGSSGIWIISFCGPEDIISQKWAPLGPTFLMSFSSRLCDVSAACRSKMAESRKSTSYASWSNFLLMLELLGVFWWYFRVDRLLSSF